MDEAVLYLSEGNPADKQGATSFGYLSSIHSSQQYQQYRQCSSNRNGSVLTGIGHGHKLIIASNNKALIQVYVWGKESPEQRIPIPEELNCLTLCKQPIGLNDDKNNNGGSGDSNNNNWLLVGGSKSGKLYIWELSSGLLLNVRESHYQAITVLKYENGFLISGGMDSRVVIWKIFDLINDLTNENGSSAKPFGILSDHTLPVTDLLITKGLINDLKLFTSSRDSTIRCYELLSKTLISTFILPTQVTSISCDPSYRCLYAGLSNGLIRQIPLFSTSNNKSNILEAVGGSGKIVTLTNDHELQFTFLHHQSNLQNEESDNIINDVTSISISMDGTTLVSGDSKGRVFVSDVITKQTNKKLKSLTGSITSVQIFQIDPNTLDSINLISSTGSGSNSSNNNNNDKNLIRSIPNLKRVLVDANDLNKHDIYKKTPIVNDFIQPAFDITEFLDDVAKEERFFTNFSNVESNVVVKTNNSSNDEQDRIKQLEAQLESVTSNYNELRSIHEELYNAHSKLLNEK